MSKERIKTRMEKNRIFGVRAMRTSTRHGQPRAMADIINHRTKRQGLMDGVNLEWTKINRFRLNKSKKVFQIMHGQIIRVLRTRPAHQPNQIVSLLNRQRFGVLDHNVDQINEDKQMYQGLVDKRMGLRRIQEMEILFQIKISFLIINNCSNFNSYRFQTLILGPLYIFISAPDATTCTSSSAK